jgi:perosamine synthetase
VWVRTQLKIKYRDLMLTVARSFRSLDRDAEAARAESYFKPELECVTCYSVRSGFDLLLQALNLQPGDEILFSALNVRAMVKVANNLGLVPVPVDVDLSTMQPKLDCLRQAISPRSKVFVAAHLFGSRVDLGDSFKLAKQHGLVTVEDCAQAFIGKSYTGSPLADVLMYSFGPIKTATALGGALLGVRDRALMARMRQIQDRYPVQPDKKHRNRAFKFIGLKLATSPPVLGSIYRYYKSRGKDYEDALADKVRDVAPLKTVEKMRTRPSALMLWLLNRRLYGFDEGSISRRTVKGRLLTSQVNSAVRLPGQANPHHDYWVYPLLVTEPKKLIRWLRSRGFDAADLPRSQHIGAPEGRVELEPADAATLMRDIVVVPCYESMPDHEIKRLGAAIREFDKSAA